jgi:hypothetical protein
LGYVPTATAVSAMNSPRCSAALNGCTTSGTWALMKRRVDLRPRDHPVVRQRGDRVLLVGKILEPQR